MRLCDVIAKIAFGTKVAVRKDGGIQHIIYNDLADIKPFLLYIEEEVKCFYVENNELLIDLDEDSDFKDLF